MIKYGDIEYFALLELNDRLKDRMLNRLDLVNVDRLRNEIEMKILEINNKYKTEKFTPDKKSTETTNFEKKRYDKNSRDGY